MATLKHYRCRRPSCFEVDNGRFWSETPVCPRCQLSAADKKFGNQIVRLVIVHFDPPTEFPAIGHNYRACDAKKAIHVAEEPGRGPMPYHAGSGDVSQVNCPACKQTNEFKEALAKRSDDEDAELDIATVAALEKLQIGAHRS